MQHLPARAQGDTDGVAVDLRDHVVERLRDPGAVPVLEETGDPTKGRCTLGVARPYPGTAGRIENAPVAA